MDSIMILRKKNFNAILAIFGLFQKMKISLKSIFYEEFDSVKKFGFFEKMTKLDDFFMFFYVFLIEI